MLRLRALTVFLILATALSLQAADFVRLLDEEQVLGYPENRNLTAVEQRELRRQIREHNEIAQRHQEAVGNASVRANFGVLGTEDLTECVKMINENTPAERRMASLDGVVTQYDPFRIPITVNIKGQLSASPKEFVNNKFAVVDDKRKEVFYLYPYTFDQTGYTCTYAGLGRDSAVTIFRLMSTSDNEKPKLSNMYNAMGARSIQSAFYIKYLNNPRIVAASRYVDGDLVQPFLPTSGQQVVNVPCKKNFAGEEGDAQKLLARDIANRLSSNDALKEKACPNPRPARMSDKEAKDNKENNPILRKCASQEVEKTGVFKTLCLAPRQGPTVRAVDQKASGQQKIRGRDVPVNR